MVYKNDTDDCGLYLRRYLVRYGAILLSILAVEVALQFLIARERGVTGGVELAWLLLPVAVMGVALVFMLFTAMRRARRAYLTLEIELTDEYIEQRRQGFSVRIPLSDVCAVQPFTSFAGVASLRVCGKGFTALAVPSTLHGFDELSARLFTLQPQSSAKTATRVALALNLLLVAAGLLFLAGEFVKRRTMCMVGLFLVCVFITIRTVIIAKSEVNKGYKRWRIVLTAVILVLAGVLAVLILQRNF